MEALALKWSNKDRNVCNRYWLRAKAASSDKTYDLALGFGVVIENMVDFSISTEVLLI